MFNHDPVQRSRSQSGARVCDPQHLPRQIPSRLIRRVAGVRGRCGSQSRAPKHLRGFSWRNFRAIRVVTLCSSADICRFGLRRRQFNREAAPLPDCTADRYRSAMRFDDMFDNSQPMPMPRVSRAVRCLGDKTAQKSSRVLRAECLRRVLDKQVDG